MEIRDTPLASEIVVTTSPVTIRRRVKWGECDSAGVVYMVNYGEYAVSAFEIFMAVLLGEGFQRSKARHGVALPAKAFAIEFYAPLRPDDDFLMTVKISDIRTRTFDITVQGCSLAHHNIFFAKLTPIAVDPLRRTSIPLPRSLLHKLQHYRETCVGQAPPAEKAQDRCPG
jgi:4-hydroxybenzoyl-CoA thioesterase